jgi:hypothetical protein
MGPDLAVPRRPVLHGLALGISCLVLPSAAAASSSELQDEDEPQGVLAITGVSGSNGAVTLTWEDDV